MILKSRSARAAFTLTETLIAVTIGTLILLALTIGSTLLMKSYFAVQQYAKGQNDEMRISDYLSLDLRRALSVQITGSTAAPPLTVTLVIPNFYQSANTPYPPHIAPVVGWPYKRHHHNHHQNVILNQVVDYGPTNGSAPTLTVQYVFDNGANTLSRVVNGVTTTIATEVKDFNVAISDVDETAQTQITFQPRFTFFGAANTAGVAGTTYYQTTDTRNTR